MHKCVTPEAVLSAYAKDFVSETSRKPATEHSVSAIRHGLGKPPTMAQ
jgi:hypothetical protein